MGASVCSSNVGSEAERILAEDNTHGSPDRGLASKASTRPQTVCSCCRSAKEDLPPERYGDVKNTRDYVYGALEDEDEWARHGKELQMKEQQIMDASKQYLEKDGGTSVYVGGWKRVDYHGFLYFDTSSTGTRPYIFLYRLGEPRERSLSEFWALTRAKESQKLTIQSSLCSRHLSNEEFMNSLAAASSDAEKLKLFEDLQVTETFETYIENTILQITKVVDKWMKKEKEKGVVFWSEESALLISDIVIAVTDDLVSVSPSSKRGLREIIGESTQVKDALAAHLTAYISNKFRERYLLNNTRLTALLLNGAEEARSEFAAVCTLDSMSSQHRTPRMGVVSMGGASVQVSMHGHHASLNVGCKEAVEASQLTFGNENDALERFKQQMKEHLGRELTTRLSTGMIQEERLWMAVSGLYYMACDNNLPTEKPVPINEILAKLEGVMTSLHARKDAPALGSAICAYAMLSHLHGTVQFQREWLNPRTNQRIAATVSTGYVLQRLGY